MIPNLTLIQIIGEERWDKIVKYCQKKFKATSILLSYTGHGLELFANSPTGTNMGELGVVELAAQKKPRKKGKK